MIELADVFRRFAANYLAAYGTSMLPSHQRAIEDIMACRTPALGASSQALQDNGTAVRALQSRLCE